MVISSAGGAPQLVYGGLCMVGDFDDGYFFSTMDDFLGAVAVDHYDM
jgi:hypothetical protein